MATPFPTQITRRTESSRLFHTWDVRTGLLTWCGNQESLWRGHRLPVQMSDWLAVVHPDELAA